MTLLLRQGLRHHVRHPLQTLLTLLGIAVGTALACAMQLSQGTAERAFDRALEAIAGDATHVVTGGPAGLDAACYAAVRAKMAGRGVAASVQTIVRVPGQHRRTVLRALGVDVLADADVRSWTANAANAGTLPIGPLMTTPGGFVATPALLARLGLRPGDELPVTIAARPFTARCVGEFRPPAGFELPLEDTLLVDIATAQEWTGRVDRVDRLDLKLRADTLPDGITVEGMLAEVAAACGSGARIEAAGAGQGGLAQLARGFRINVRALSLLALLVGAFLVHETMRLSVVARRRSFGVLRALGARGRSLGAVVALESGVLGAVGGAIGAALAVLFAQLLVDPLVRTLNDHYATFELHHVEIDPFVLGGGLLLAILVATAAGLGPALAASRVPPREVLTGPRPAPAERRRLAGCAILPGSLAVALLTTTGDSIVQGHLGTLSMLVAAAMVVPSTFGALLGLAARAVRPAGPLLRYVVRSLGASRDHLAMPVAAMVLALAATVGLATLIGSFRATVAGWLEQVLPADVYVMVPGGVDERPRSTIAPEIVAALRGAPGVEASSTYQRTLLRVQGGHGDGDVEVVGIAPTPQVLRAFPFVEGDDVEGRAALLRGDGAWVSEPLAFRWGCGVGDRLTIAASNGLAAIAITGVYRDYANERGEVLVGSKWFASHVEGGVTALSLHARPGVGPEDLVADLRERAAATAQQDVLIRSQGELRAASLAIFDRSFAITGVMRLLCLVVAFFGIYSAFAALQLERGGEVGLLRCLGARPAWIGAAVVAECALAGLCAGVLAVPVGTLLGQVMAHVINRVSFGWTLLAVDVPTSAIVEVVLLAVAAAAFAGIQPALRFARMRPADALREA